ncbi:unnamed protein product, partial [Discosporangium mesarthrocarpum]
VREEGAPDTRQYYPPRKSRTSRYQFWRDCLSPFTKPTSSLHHEVLMPHGTGGRHLRPQQCCHQHREPERARAEGLLRPRPRLRPWVLLKA